jgi:ketosteroid isomerase-like protein
MSEETLALARRGFAAWQQGDFDTIEAMLDPAVSWHWFESGDWDCKSRDDVMRTLRQRHEQGFARSSLDFVDAREDTVIVVSHPREVGGADWPEETATTIRFRDGKVVEMQDYRTRQDAIAALS